MKITEMSVKRGVTFAMIYLIAVFFGLFSLARLKLDLYPKMEFPIIAIITQYTGVGPFDLETVVTRPIEETVASVENVESVTSTTSQGLSVINIEFDWGTDMDQAEIDVRNSMEWVDDMLPDDVTDPLIFSFDPSTQPVLYLTVNSDLHGMAELRKISEHEIEPRIERIPGVASAFTNGGMEREIKIQVDPARLRAHNMAIEQVSNALRANNLQVASGWIENDKQEFSIETAGEYKSIDEIENTNIMTIDNTVIRVRDVATVVDGFKEQRQRIWNDGHPAVMLMVQKQSDANTVTTAKEVLAQLDNIEKELPEGVQIGIMMDLSSFIVRSMSNLGWTAIQAIVLAFLVLLLFLRNFASSLVVAISIPVSMVVTFAVMDQADLTLNVISMAGLALAVGLLVDNSIVVLESIFRYREQGMEPREAAIKGAQEVAMAITASTLTTLSVFVPVLFVPGLAGELFNEMVITICFSLAVSLVVALTLIPLMSSRLLKLVKFQKNNNAGAVEKNSKFLKIIDYYKSRLNWSIHHRKIVLWSTFIIFVLFIVLLSTRGGEFLPEGDDGFMTITVDRSPGTSLDDMENTMRQVTAILESEIPEAEMIYSNFGQGEGIMALFSSQTSAEGDITIRLPKITDRDRSVFDIQEALRDTLKSIPDADVSFADRGEAAMFGNAADIVVKVIGHDLDVAEALANDIIAEVKDIEGIVDVESSVREAKPELKVNLDRQRIADLGLSTAQVGSAVSTSILGTVVTQYREQGDEYDVRVQFDKEHRAEKQDIENILIMTPFGRQVPLRSIADIEYDTAPQDITREDQERYISVNIDVANRDLRTVTKDVQVAVDKVPVPNDFRLELGGTAEDMQESFMYLGLAMLVAILLTYMVMASQFESFVDPFIIMFTIPLSLIGVSLGLIVTNTTLSVMALIGVIMLVGIVVNNGIVLVDYINQLRDRGMELYGAILEAGSVRMRPVLMTALTTILAMLPMALGLGESGESWAPMARSVMGGMAVATLLTLVIVPVIYASVEESNAKRKAKRKARKEAKLYMPKA